jgi:hypothetical protein
MPPAALGEINQGKLANLMAGIINCPTCGAENFFDKNRSKNSVAHLCFHIRKKIAARL